MYELTLGIVLVVFLSLVEEEKLISIIPLRND